MPAAKKDAGSGVGSKADNVVPLRTPRPCPICGKKSTQDFHPFCSKHCADVDLNRWLKGSYAIPALEPPDDWNEGEGGSSADRDDGEDER